MNNKHLQELLDLMRFELKLGEYPKIDNIESVLFKVRNEITNSYALGYQKAIKDIKNIMEKIDKYE